MNLPTAVAALVKAQDQFDSAAYADCFSETALVFDEGKTHRGRTEISQWIEQSNEKYKTVMTPMSFVETGKTGVLSAKVSGSFDGSPIVLNYHFEIADALIQSLKITG